MFQKGEKLLGMNVSINTDLFLHVWPAINRHPVFIAQFSAPTTPPWDIAEKMKGWMHPYIPHLNAEQSAAAHPEH